jgi:hypothetical protein
MADFWERLQVDGNDMQLFVIEKHLGKVSAASS